MAMFLIAVCTALVSAGFALECEVCLAINTDTCSGHYVTCKTPQSRCMVTLTETSVTDGENTYSSGELEKSCASAYDCTHPATLYSKDFKVRVTRKCCDRDFCNNGTFTWETPDPTPNGLKCDSCFSRNSDKCDVTTPIDCTGDDTYCVHYTAWRDRGSHITVAGCASESMKKSEGKAAFRGSSVMVQNSVPSWRCDARVLTWLTAVATLCFFFH